MHIDLISLVAGMILVSILWAFVAGAKQGSKSVSSEEDPAVIYTRGISQTLDDILKLLQSVGKNIRDNPIPQPEWQKESQKLGLEAVYANTEACKALTVEMANAHAPSSKEDYNWLVSILEPHKDALFRIAADTELSKKKFDVLAKLIGLDDKAAYANHMDRNEDEDNELVFNEMVVQEMKDQGLNWSQAVDTVKSRMAHRSRVR